MFEIFLGLSVSVLSFFVLHNFKRWSVYIGDPLLENPYGNHDYGRNMPRKLRFVRVPITSKYFKLKSAFCTMVVKSIPDNLNMDCPGILHWQRQPRSGVPHPAELHKSLKNEDDIVDHMIEYHFSNSAPVDIGLGYTDKIDIFFRIEGMKEVLFPISRENRIPSGKYEVRLYLDADSLRKPLTKTFRIQLGDDLEEFKVLQVKKLAYVKKSEQKNLMYVAQ